MKGVLTSLKTLREANLEIEGWFWKVDEGIELEQRTQLPVMGARALRPLQGLVYSVQASLLFWWRYRVLRRERPDVVYCVAPYVAACDVAHCHFSPWDWERRMAAMGCHSLRDWLERAANLINRWWMEFFLARTSAHTLIAVSEALANDIQLAAPDKRVVVLPNAFDPDRFHIGVREQWRAVVREELKLPNSESVFVFVSTGHYRRKGFFLAVDAVAKVHKAFPEARLLVVGGKEATLIKLQGQLNERHADWKRWLIFTGQTATPEKYLAAADGFLFPSWSEAMALVEVEAAACGLPLFLTRHHGSEMVLRDGSNGRLLEFDAGEIAKVLTEFVSGMWRPTSADLKCGLDRQTYANHFLTFLLKEDRANAKK